MNDFCLPRGSFAPLGVCDAEPGRAYDRTHDAISGWFSSEPVYATLVDKLPWRAAVVEVGCLWGRSACFLARTASLSGKQVSIDCVDPWEMEVTAVDGTTSKTDKFAEILWFDERPPEGMTDFAANLVRTGVFDAVRPVRLASIEAAELYPDCSVDAVFLDALHDFESVWEDLRAWWPKVRVGGMLAGHDYYPVGVLYPDVRDAVTDFFGVDDDSLVSDAHSSWGVVKLADAAPPFVPRSVSPFPPEPWFENAASAIKRDTNAVVEVGCWDCRLTVSLAEKARSVWAVDTFSSADRKNSNDRRELFKTAAKRGCFGAQQLYVDALERAPKNVKIL